MWPDDLLSAIRAGHDPNRPIVVLDDDPTGTQTVADVPVLTSWTIDVLADELRRSPVFFVLTNSRSLSAPDAVELAIEIGRNLAAAADETGTRPSVISRSDSTLRGHFPAEVDALIEAMGGDVDVPWSTVLVPFFAAGGRVTVGDVHYVAEPDPSPQDATRSRLVPVAETEFARDVSFGFVNSNLRDWIEEKTAGRIPARDVVGIGLDLIRNGGPDAVHRLLVESGPGATLVVNALDDRDLEVVVMAMLAAEADGHRFIQRTAASFVQVRSGQPKRPLLSRADPGWPVPEAGLVEGRSEGQPVGGLVVVGSHVERSTRQLAKLADRPDVEVVEMSVDQVELDPGTEIDRCRCLVTAIMVRGDSAVLATSRRLRTGETADASLAVSRRVSSAVCAVVGGLTTRPAFLIAKGGITSSDIATRSLGIRRAVVRGQLQPGVPVWETGDETLFPGLVYVIYPGNVGTDQGLSDALDALA